jgi:heme oxygenase/predicted heme/steroid binding protein
MDHPWMKSIYAKSFDQQSYVHYLAGQYHMFHELEDLCISRQHEWPLKAVYDEALHRTDALRQDLRFWAGEAWEQRVATPSPQTAKYLQQLRKDSNDPFLLLCHHFLQYNAVLSGGQFLGSMVSARASADHASGDSGAALYDFPAECQPTHARVQSYIDAVDALEISDELRARMLTCMRAVYALLLSSFDESYEVAPTQGISYSASKNAAAAASGEVALDATAQTGKRKRVPPPPMAPKDRAFTLKELAAHNGQREDLPILTAVLGRVYDVSGARDLFGHGGPYEMFAGHDGTYNLAVMSLKKHTLNKFDYELDDDDKECLADWIAYFDNRYSQPLGEIRDRQHAVSLGQLPRATKIPFSNEYDDDDDDSTHSESAGTATVTAVSTASTPTSKL